MHRRIIAALALLPLFAATACAVATPVDSSAPNEDDGDDALQGSDVIARAESWVAVRMPYCQSANHQRDYDAACSTVCERPDNSAWDPYRSDCSGLVSYAWGLPAPGRVTTQFAPFVNDITHVIDGHDLQPGDALNNDEHVILFKQWIVAGESAVFVEEPGCSSSTPYAHEFSSSVGINGGSVWVPAEGMTFTSIHFDGIDGSPAPAAAEVEPYYRGLAADATGHGYWIVGQDGGIFSYGDGAFHGSMGGKPLAAEVVAIAATPSGNGYWLTAKDGGVFGFGGAGFHGSMGGKTLAEPIVGIAATPSGNGYWLVASDGGIFAFGDAGFHGSMGGQHLNAPVVGMAATPTGNGYWMVASDGGIFSFGDAGFYGSMGGTHLNAPVVGMAASPDGGGYWMVAEDGGIFSFGDAGFYGSMGGKHLNVPVVGMARTPSGKGYWLVGGDGGIFTFGDAGFYGSRG